VISATQENSMSGEALRNGAVAYLRTAPRA
jgi:hypothetical protein